MPNIVNPESIADFVDILAQRAWHPGVGRWCKRNLRNYLARDERWYYPFTDRAVCVQFLKTQCGITDLPAWADDAFVRRETVDGFHIAAIRQDDPHFLDDLFATIDYLNQVYGAEHDCSRLSVLDAVDASNAWHAEHARMLDEQIDTSETEEDVQLVRTFEDGYRLVRLVSRDAYQREGRLMGHCVGGYFGSRTRIISLRDPQNRPHATIELDVRKKSKRPGLVAQCQGKQNRPPIPKYFPYIRSFIIENNYGVNQSTAERFDLVDLGGITFGTSEDLINWLVKDDQDAFRNEIVNTPDGTRHEAFNYLMNNADDLSAEYVAKVTAALTPATGSFEIVDGGETYTLSRTHRVNVLKVRFARWLWTWLFYHARADFEKHAAAAVAKLTLELARRPYDIYMIEKPGAVVEFGFIIDLSGRRDKFQEFKQALLRTKKDTWSKWLSEAKTDIRRYDRPFPAETMNFMRVVLPRFDEFVSRNEAL